jgi:alpha-D-ribose 1-methylphosphonate 5-triphosphate synthase subunit PhnH
MFPAYTASERHTRETFLALMNALAYPGRAFALPAGDPFSAIAHTLIDLETSFYTPDSTFHAVCAATGANAQPVERAAYVFFPAITPSLIDDLTQAHAGTIQNPDTAATLILPCDLNSGTRMTWTGAGINGEIAVTMGGLPHAFWEIRRSVCRFPLGWDCLLVAGDHVIGLPRTTRTQEVS